MKPVGSEWLGVKGDGREGWDEGGREVEEKWKFAVIGGLILTGVVADELFRRWNDKRRRLG